MNEKTLALTARGGEKVGVFSVEDIIARMNNEIEEATKWR